MYIPASADSGMELETINIDFSVILADFMVLDLNLYCL